MLPARIKGTLAAPPVERGCSFEDRDNQTGEGRCAPTGGVDGLVYLRYGEFMAETTTIRVSRDTHAQVVRVAAERQETLDETISRAVRALRQDAMAQDLAAELTEDETAWLDAEAG